MRMLMLVWLFLMAGGLGALLVRKDSGYALLSWDVWTVEMSLATLVLVALLLFASVYLLTRATARIFEIPSRLQDWQHRHQTRRAQQSLTRGQLQLAEGEWEKSERSLVQYAEQSDTPLLNYLVAAKAAQSQGAHDRRDAYIRLAHKHVPSADVAVGLTQAELQLADEQLELALATLIHLRGIAPRHRHVLKLIARLYERLGEWKQLLELLPTLRKQKVLDNEQLSQLEIKAHKALLDQAAAAGSLDRAWSQMPKALQQNPQLLLNYATHLHEINRDPVAEPLLRQSIKKSWDQQLVLLYGLLNGEDPKQQLNCAEALLEQQPHNPVLLLTLGRLSLRDKLWGKAKSYLEASISASGPVEACQELGHLLETMGEPDKALAVYREGINKTATGNTIPLPKSLGRPATTASTKATTHQDNAGLVQPYQG